MLTYLYCWQEYALSFVARDGEKDQLYSLLIE